jgi:hypothetical protein
MCNLHMSMGTQTTEPVEIYHATRYTDFAEKAPNGKTKKMGRKDRKSSNGKGRKADH